MKVILNGEEYTISWKHHNYTYMSLDKFEGGVRPTSYTECIFENSNKNLIDTTTAELSPKDNYNRAMGRQLTLKRLIKRLPLTFRALSKEERTLIWDCYKNLKKGKLKENV